MRFCNSDRVWIVDVRCYGLVASILLILLVSGFGAGGEIDVRIDSRERMIRYANDSGFYYALMGGALRERLTDPLAIQLGAASGSDGEFAMPGWELSPLFFQVGKFSIDAIRYSRK